MDICALALFCVLFLISSKVRNGICISDKDDHIILKRQIDLLPGGVGTHFQSRRSTLQPQCLQNEYGPNCTYCVPSDTCEDGHFTCDLGTGDKVCLQGYHGENCKLSSDLINEYHVTCPENTCRNGGTCSSGRCCCRTGFTGILCEIEIIECKNHSCLNGGICKDLIGNFECLCKPSFHGKNCELHIDPHVGTTPSGDSSCQSKSCKNNGTCLEDTFLTYCLCPTYYTGTNCETRVGKPSGLQTGCPSNYYGNGCKVYCKPQDNCIGHYVCDQTTGDKICLSGWHGLNCETRILPQRVDPLCPKHGCKNDGQCFNKRCCCRYNYTGDYCQVESIGCLSNPCKNNATCVNQGNGYACLCQLNFTGKICETDITARTTDVVTTYYIHSNAFTISASSGTTVIQGNPLYHSIQPSSTSFLVSPSSLASSLQSKPVSLNHMTSINTDMSNSNSHNYLLNSESQLSFTEFLYSASTPLMTAAYSSSKSDTFSSTSDIDFEKSSRVLSLSVNPTLKSTQNVLHTSSPSSLTLFNSFQTTSSFYIQISSYIRPTTLHATSSFESSYPSSLSFESSYPSSLISEYLDNTPYQLPLTGLHSNYISKSLISSEINPSFSDRTAINSLSSISSHFISSPVLIYPTITSNKVNSIMVPVETRHISDYWYSLLPVTKSQDSNSVENQLKTTIKAASSSVHNSEISSKSSSKIYTLLTSFSTSSMSLSNSLSTLPTYASTNALKSSVFHNSVSKIIIPTSTYDLSTSENDLQATSYSFSTVISDINSNHLLSLPSSTVQQTSFLHKTRSIISTKLPTKYVSSEHESSSKAENTFLTTVPSTQGRSIVSSSSYINLQPTPALGSAVISSTDIITHTHIPVNVSPARVSNVEPSPLGRVSLLTTVTTKLNITSDRTDSNRLQPSVTPHISSSSIEVSSLASVGPNSSSIPSTHLASPSISTSFHVSATSILDTSYTIPSLFSQTVNSQSTQVNSDNLLNSEQHITSSAVSVNINPTKTQNELSSSDGLRNTPYYSVNTAIGGSEGSTWIIIPTKSSSQIRTSSRDNNNNIISVSTDTYSTLHGSTIDVSTQSQTRNLDFMTQSALVDHSFGPLVITDFNDNQEDEKGLSKTWRIALIVIACVLFLLAVGFLVAFLSVRQRRKDSRTIRQSPSEIQDFSKEHFSEQPDFNNPTYDIENDSDDDSVKYDIYVVNE